MRVTTFTRWPSAPSSRFRIRQYSDVLAANGITLRDFSLPDPRGASRFGKWILGSKMIAARIPAVIDSYRSDISYLSKEMIPGRQSLEGIIARPWVIDIDDAIWVHPRDGQFAWKLAEKSDAVICGNSYLASQFQKYNAHTYTLPTGVDTRRFQPFSDNSKNFIIGWTGTAKGFHWLYKIEEALEFVLSNRPNVRLRIVADAHPDFSQLNPDKVDFIKWSPSVEVSAIQGMSVGIMPLDDTMLSRGKCSYKLLLYMACGLPIIASPIGMNKDVLAAGNVGFGAKSMADWIEGLFALIDRPSLACELGLNARKVVERDFDSAQIGNRLAQILRDCRDTYLKVRQGS